MRNLTINSKLIDLQSHTSSVFGNDPPGPTPGCQREEVCDAAPCLNGGQCHGGWQGFSCECGESFADDTCSTGNFYITLHFGLIEWNRIM